jgi:hypothetical protein
VLRSPARHSPQNGFKKLSPGRRTEDCAPNRSTKAILSFGTIEQQKKFNVIFILGLPLVPLFFKKTIKVLPLDGL